jgi:MFS family permease
MPSTPERKRAFHTFSAAALLNDLGADAIRPFWPAFVTAVLGAPVAVLGLLDGIGEAISYGSRFPAGWLSDKMRRRKPLIWLGYFFAAIARLGYAIAPAVAWLFPLKAVERLGKLRDPPRDALLADVTPRRHRGQAFGTLHAMDRLGAAIGPVLGLVLFAALSYRGLFLVAAVPSLIGAAAVAWLVHEHRPKPLKLNARNMLGHRFKLLTVLSALFALGWISLSFMTLHATVKQGTPLLLAPALFIAMSLAATMSSAFFGKLSDRIGRRKSLLISYAIYPAVALGFLGAEIAGITGAAGIAISTVLFASYGLHFGAMTALQSAFVADIVPSASRAYASGSFQAVFGFSALAASIAAGLLWDIVAPAAAFGYAFIVSAAAVAAMAVFLK